MKIKRIKTTKGCLGAMENQTLLKKCKKIQKQKGCQNCSRKTVAWNWFCNTVTNGNKKQQQTLFTRR
jgi:hypothetical protein